MAGFPIAVTHISPQTSIPQEDGKRVCPSGKKHDMT